VRIPKHHSSSRVQTHDWADTALALEGRQCFLFVRVGVEDGGELGDLRQVADSLCEMEQLDFAPFVSGGW
jgi:hypothetical protein